MKNLCIIFGGPTPEYNVSLATATDIIRNVNTAKYQVFPVGISRSGEWYHYTGAVENITTDEWLSDDSNLAAITAADLICMNIDVVFPASHGNYCEDGQLQAELESVGIPFVGSSSRASAMCMNKSATKARMDALGIRQAPYIVVGVDAHIDPSALALLTYPLFVKPSSAGSSIGISKVSTSDELAPAITEAQKYDDIVIIEQGIVGREVEVAVLEGNFRNSAVSIVSECGEIIPGSDFYCYDTKYIADTASYHIPADISPECSDKIRQLAMEIFTNLGCRGLARVDFFVTANEDIIFNEINTIPGFTPISMYPKLLMHGGMTYGEIIETLVEGA